MVTAMFITSLPEAKWEEESTRVSVNVLTDHEVRAVIFGTDCKNIDNLRFHKLSTQFLNFMKLKSCTELYHLS